MSPVGTNLKYESVEPGTKPKLHGISRAGNKTLTTWNQSSREQNLINYMNQSSREENLNYIKSVQLGTKLTKAS